MSHLATETIHAFAQRAIDLRVDVDTSSGPLDFSSISFRIDDDNATNILEKSTGFLPSAGGNGVLIDFTLSASDLTLSPGTYRWELTAIRGGQLRTLAQGWFQLGAEPTQEGSA